MRSALEHPLASDRKGFARHQLSLPIARVPITIQSSVSTRSPVHATASLAPHSPATPATPGASALPATLSLPTRHLSRNGVKLSGSTEFGQLPSPPPPVKSTALAQVPDSRPRLSISSPRQHKLPKLNLGVPELSARFCAPCSDSSDSSDTPTTPALSSNDTNDDHHPAPHTTTAAAKAFSRRVSWSPSQAIPGGHYSKGFTLTSFQKTGDKASSSASSASSSASSAAASLTRSNTSHLQRRETLRRLVGRSTSMKVKTPAPFAIMSTDNSLRTERFASFYDNSDSNSNSNRNSSSSSSNSSNSNSDDQENAHPHQTKAIDIYDAKFTGRNTPSDSTKHNNTNHSQNRPLAPLALDKGRNIDAFNSGKPIPPPKPIPAPGLSILTTSSTQQVARPAIATMCIGNSKPLWQHTMTNAEQIDALGICSQEIQKQETIFELIYTESEYLDDLKSIHKIFVEELNVKMAESRRKKRFSIDKADVKLYERLARLLSHIKDLWNGHQSLLRSLQNKQQQESPLVVDIGSVFESFYMFSIYDSYFAQYTTTSRDFQHITAGNSELCLIIKDLLNSPRCKSLTLEGLFLKPIQRLQKYPLFFKDLLNLTPKTDPDYKQLEHALNNHQRELTKIDDRIWIEEHNEMLTDLQQRIKGLPSNFSLVEKHRYLILDGPVHRITVRQPTKFSLGKHGANSKSESHVINESMEWRDGFRSPIANFSLDDDPPTIIHRPSQLDYHHLHAKPAFSSSPPSSSLSSSSPSHSALTSPSSPFPNAPTARRKSAIDTRPESLQRTGFYLGNPSSPPSATTLTSLSSASSPTLLQNSPTSSSSPSKHQPTVSQLVSKYNFNMSSSFSSLTGAGHPRNISSSALYLPSIIKNSTDVEAEYHIFVFTDIVLWTKRVMSRYHRKEGTPWNFKLVEPVSRLTSVCNTSEDNIFMCTSVNTSSTSYLVRTEDVIAARMWRTIIPTLIPFHCSRNIRDLKKK